MGQKPSHQMGGGFNKSKLPISWILRGHETTLNPYPDQPIKFQYKTKRKQKIAKQNNNVHTALNNYNNKSSINQSVNINVKNVNEVKCQLIKTQNLAPIRAKSEPNLAGERNRDKHRHRKRSAKVSGWHEDVQQFGYEIQDIDAFLTKATIEKPANIPVVLAFPSVLYQTRIGGYQAEISLPLGMVVNAVFKNQHWLYVQTPHAEEGYVSYAACLPLGIIPPAEEDKSAPCWEVSTDVFPKPSGNLTDTEKLSSKSECGGGRRCRSRSRYAASSCGEKSFDKLYLRATKHQEIIRQTLLAIICDYEHIGNNSLNVKKGDVVILIDTPVEGWFWVKNKVGVEGFIPAAVAGHGFL